MPLHGFYDLKAAEQGRALDKDARAVVNDLVGQAVLLDVLHNVLVVSTGLQPERRDAQRLRLFNNPESYLQIIVSSQMIGRPACSTYFGASNDANSSVSGVRQLGQ